MNDSGALLADGAVDPHYRLIVSADPAAPGPDARVVVGNAFPIPPWLANGPSSKWIAPASSQAVGNRAGDYVYRLSFSLDGFQPATAAVSGRWTSDNAGVGIRLNGVDTGQSQGGNFDQLHDFAIASGFVAGVNTLDFVVNNAGDSANPTGLRVEISGAAERDLPPGIAPTILDDPDDATTALGGGAVFRVSATGSAPLTYEWRRNGQPLPDSDVSTLSLAGVSAGDAGSYRVEVRNPWGTALSGIAILNVEGVGSVAHRLQTQEPPGPATRRTGLVITEVHYHPGPDPDGRDPEFIELHNSNPWPEPVGGYRIEGDWEFTIPEGTELPANGYLVLSPRPNDVMDVYGISGVLGGGAGSLSNAGPQIRLRKPSGALLIDLEIGDREPWPAPADGQGPSLVLARPSIGNGDPRSWEASALTGGSPGARDPLPSGPLRQLVLNEFLAAPGDGGQEFVEVYNHGPIAVDMSGCRVTDDLTKPGHLFPAGTVIPAGGHVVVAGEDLGFGLAADGEWLLLLGPGDASVLDAIPYGGQSPQTAFGRSPDGDERWDRLSSPSPGGTNQAPLPAPVVINEIHYHPISGDERDEFLELHNPTGSAVDLGGWRFTAGVDFAFPAGASIAAGGFVVVTPDRSRLLESHPGIPPSAVHGDYGGQLSNSGERIALAMPVPRADGTGVYFVEVDTVSYRDGGTWGRWSDGGGSSLELVHPLADNRLAAHWADSDESDKAPWTTIEHTDVLELGKGTADQLQIFLLGAGEAMIDDVEVLPQGGGNRIANGTFSSGAAGWTFRGTHRTSGIEAQAGASGAGLRLRAVERGDLTVNKVRTPLTAPLGNGSTATLRAKARWMAGHPEVLLRVRGNHIEAVGALSVPRNLGTPGAPNSRLRSVVPPVVDQLLHRPVLPPAAEPVRVTARITSPTPAAVTLEYRIDPSPTSTSAPMRDDGNGADLVAGDGIHSAFIPGQGSGVLAAFRVRAASGQAPATAVVVHPPDGPGGAVEGLVRWGEPSYPGEFGTYRIWLTRARRDEWTNREKLSNEPVSVTFVYNNSRAVYEAGALYSGSAYTSPGYNSPTGTICGYNVVFPDDDRFLGEDEITLDFPVRDPTAQREPLMYWFLEQFGLPNNYRRYVNVFVNGIGQRQRGGWGTNANVIYEDVQQPGADAIREWFDGAEGGSLFKGDYWHEFDDAGNRIDPATANTLEEFLSSTGGKRKARYRWTWRPRAVEGSADDFDPLFRLVDAFNVSNDDFPAAVEGTVDIGQWMRTFAMNDLAANWDSFGNPGGKNTFHYLPPGDRWQLMSWDFDVGIGVFNNPVDAPLFSVSDPRVQRLYQNPAFMREYWRALDEAVGTFFQSSAVSPVLNARYAAFQASGVPATSPNVPSGESGLSIPAWVTQRRAFLVGQLGNVAADFAITTNGGNPLVTGDSVVALRGTAPVQAATLLLNGNPVPVRWLNATSWEILAPVVPGSDTWVVEGADEAHSPIPGLVDTIAVTGTGTPEPPSGRLVISEIMYRPIPGGAEFVEIANHSATTGYDIGGWRLNGVGLVFPSGTVIPPSGHLVVAGSREAFGRTHGWEIPVAAEFSGTLDNGGETLTLIQPFAGPGGADLAIDSVRYDDDPPWPVAAGEGLGSSLQLVDPAQDNRRVGNWAAVATDQGPPPILLPLDAEWRYFQSGFAPPGWTLPEHDDSLWPRGPALLYAESAALPGPKNTALALGPIAYYFRTSFEHEGPPGSSPSLDLVTVLDDGAVIYLNGQELHRVRMPAGEPTPFTLATEAVDNAVLEGPLRVPAPMLVEGTNVLAVEVHQSVQNSTDVVWGLEIAPGGATLAASTPGAPNSVAATLPELADVWINEIQTRNVSGPRDGRGERDPWLELVNAGADPVSLADWYLTDDPAQPRKWQFPEGAVIGAGQFTLVWLDGEPSENTATEWHAGFGVLPTGKRIELVHAPAGVSAATVDAVIVPELGDDESSGLLPDGEPGPVRRFAVATPGAPNGSVIEGIPVFINEWMADNDRVPDPADGDFDDWFELFNAGADPIDLSGFLLTDDLGVPSKFTIPAGTVIAAGSHLVVWADEEPEQWRAGGDLHATFRLSASGEEIGLFAPDGTLVDSVIFGPQARGASSGIWPDGGAEGGVVYELTAPSPGAANRMAPATPAIVPAVEAVLDPGGAGVTITFTTEFGRFYLVQFSSDLAEGGWMDLAPAVPGFGDPASVIDAAQPSARRFYRVLVFDEDPD